MNKPLKAFLVVGARPNYMKIAPILRKMKARPEYFDPIIIHTGQHYDANMSDSFFSDLDLPKPRFFLGVGSGSHAEQTAKIMIAFDKILQEEQPELLLVVGDVNSTLGCALVASKIQYDIGNDTFKHPFIVRNLRPFIVHVEAGLRSFDRTMPEEVNRIITDSLADLLFIPSPEAHVNLSSEGISTERISYVGNVMVDTIELLKPAIASFVSPDILEATAADYGLITIHRPSNVDISDRLFCIARALMNVSSKINLIFPVHPRTKLRLQQDGLYQMLADHHSIKLLEPLPYIKFMKLLFHCKFVLTDSGGLQEETTYLAKPCLTLRSNTERPVTISCGTNELVGVNDLEAAVDKIVRGNWKTGGIPEYWDGNSAERIVGTLLAKFCGNAAGASLVSG